MYSHTESNTSTSEFQIFVSYKVIDQEAHEAFTKTVVDTPARIEQKQVIDHYDERVIGYCTLCTDGTFSQTCAVGRGACSYHGGVLQYNYPQKLETPVYKYEDVVVPEKSHSETIAAVPEKYHMQPVLFVFII